MKDTFEVVDLWEIVNGDEKVPPDSKANKLLLWKKKDKAAKSLLTQCIKSNLVVKVAHATSSHHAWSILETEYSQTGPGSIMLWFKRLTMKYVPADGSITNHITGYQAALRALANAEFLIPEYIAAAILISTLPSDPNNPESWSSYISTVKLDKSSTTLASAINGINDAKRRTTPEKTEEQKLETALATLEQVARSHGRLFCQNCKREGHDTKSCWARGGAKEGQGPRSKKKSGRKKGKEKAHNIDEEGDEDSHVVFEKCLMSTFSTYSQREGSLSTSLQHSLNDEDLAYSADTDHCSSTIIDSGTSSHIHSIRSDFISCSTSATGNINGFGDGKKKIEGRGEVHMLAKLPKSGSARLRPKDTCYVPNTSPSLISVSQLDEADCYTIFGKGHCISIRKSHLSLTCSERTKSFPKHLRASQGILRALNALRAF